MSSTQVSSDTATEASGAAPVPLRLEVVILPIADVDRAKSFYQGLGWWLDADASAGDDFRVVQLTPPASTASIIFGKGITSAQPGSIMVLAVDDIDAARDELRSHGVKVRTRVGVSGGPPMDIPALAALLHETAEHHGSFEAVAPPHDWWDWYAAYMDAREIGSTPDEASAAAGRYMAKVKHVVVSPV